MALLGLMLLAFGQTVLADQYPTNKPPYKFEVPKTNNDILFKSNQKYIRTIYVDAENGSDSNTGLTPKTPIQSLAHLATMDITFGDQVLLKGNQVHTGTIELIDINKHLKKNKVGAKLQRIHIGSYGAGKATIDFKGYPAGVFIKNTSGVDVTDLKITGNGGPSNTKFMIRDKDKHIKQRYGVRVVSKPDIKKSLVHDLKLYNLDIYDIFVLNSSKESRACSGWDMKDSMSWGYGVHAQVERKGLGIHTISIDYVNVRNTSHTGIQVRGRGSIDADIKHNVNDLRITNSTTFQTGGPGMQFNRCKNSSMRFCHITESGNRSDMRKWGRGSGMWTWGCHTFLLEHNVFEGAQGLADSCGAHIDFNCTNVVIQYCFSRYNCGGFVEILGKNHNCCYRYNVSINDGWRNLKDDKPVQSFWGKVGAPGDVITINGHNHDRQYIGPYSSYVYNNTVIVTENGNAPYTNPFKFKIATSNRGVLLMNNLFWFAKKMDNGWSGHRWKDGADYDYAYDFKISHAKKGPKVKVDRHGSYPAKVRPMNKKELAKMNVVMKNNVYKLFNPKGTDKFSKVANALPEGYWDENALGGNPGFANENGREITDAIPSNAELINQGMPVRKLKSDKTKKGIVFGGLKMKKDIFGNPIKGNIIGAIVANPKKTTMPTE